MASEVVLIQEVVVKPVRMEPGAAERRDQLLQEGKCIACEQPLDNNEHVRVGQCTTCYQATRKAERAGTVTRRKLIAAGKALPNSAPGRKPVNKYTQQLSEAAK